MQSSPRRSPRISLDSPRRQSPRIQEKQAANLSVKGRSSTGGLKVDKENKSPNGSPIAKKAKVARRAYSVGGERLRKVVPEKDNTISIVPSRRNVVSDCKCLIHLISYEGIMLINLVDSQPGPRKSAIRALPPQVFDSPSNAGPPPPIKSSATSTDGISAIGGAELMELMNSFKSARGRKIEEQQKQVTRKSVPASTSNPAASTCLIVEEKFEDDNTIARKKRRVTFNPYQERT